MIRITAKRKTGFYRCGHFHPGTPQNWDDDFWTPEQLAILQAEPMLKVEKIPDVPVGAIHESPPQNGGDGNPYAYVDIDAGDPPADPAGDTICHDFPDEAGAGQIGSDNPAPKSVGAAPVIPAEAGIQEKTGKTRRKK